MAMQDTICAISTIQGNGAIAVLRLTGSKASTIVDSIFVSKQKDKKLVNQKTQTLHFGAIYENNELIDEVLVSVFKAPNSYTGENLVEISCHGSLFIQNQILQLLVKHGARIAQPGEFTQRAYLNGKLDLAQAEAVADLIASSSKAAHKVAMNQMRGGISTELQRLRADLLQFISLIELELDFSEEDVEFADREKLRSLIENIDAEISTLIKSFELGNAIKNGVPVAIVGEPNVGKSTLLNAILNEDKAIVSEIAGTTRDVIEDTFNLNGITYRFIDTAGLRKTTDTIEVLGIEKTYQKIKQADIVLALFDVEDNAAKINTALYDIFEKSGENKKVILVFNKADKNCDNPIFSHKLVTDLVSISAKENTNIEVLLQCIQKTYNLDKIDSNQVIVTNARHVEALTLAKESLDRVLTGLESGITNDFLAMDIREVIHHLAGITGEEITTDEVLGNIFGQFCIGK